MMKKIIISTLFLILPPLILSFSAQKANAQTTPPDTAVSPGFGSIGDCEANSNCPPTAAQPSNLPENQPIDTQPSEAIQPSGGDQQAGNQDVKQQITKLIDLIKQLLGGKCSGEASGKQKGSSKKKGGKKSSGSGSPAGSDQTQPVPSTIDAQPTGAEATGAADITGAADTTTTTNSIGANGLLSTFTVNHRGGRWGKGRRWGHGKRWGLRKRWGCGRKWQHAKKKGSKGAEEGETGEQQPANQPPADAATSPAAGGQQDGGQTTTTQSITGTLGSTAWVAPSSDTCPSNYALTSSLGQNFGDPQCNFTKDAASALLTQLDPSEATAWFNTVIPCESSYNPNAFAPPVGSQATLDAGGAWGLYQMGSSTPPGTAPPAPGKNGANDRGDVNWQVQTVNATTTRQTSGWGYWACKP